MQKNLKQLIIDHLEMLQILSIITLYKYNTHMVSKRMSEVCIILLFYNNNAITNAGNTLIV